MTKERETQPKTYGDTRINIGGLMRCCTETIRERVNERMSERLGQPVDGVIEVLDCKYMKPPDNRQILLDARGVWRWNQEGARHERP